MRQIARQEIPSANIYNFESPHSLQSASFLEAAARPRCAIKKRFILEGLSIGPRKPSSQNHPHLHHNARKEGAISFAESRPFSIWRVGWGVRPSAVRILIDKPREQEREDKSQWMHAVTFVAGKKSGRVCAIRTHTAQPATSSVLYWHAANWIYKIWMASQPALGPPLNTFYHRINSAGDTANIRHIFMHTPCGGYQLGACASPAGAKTLHRSRDQSCEYFMPSAGPEWIMVMRRTRRGHFSSSTPLPNKLFKWTIWGCVVQLKWCNYFVPAGHTELFSERRGDTGDALFPIKALPLRSDAVPNTDS